jgi:hypothetical protein
MNTSTRRRAERAIATIKALAHSRLRGSEIILPDATVFCGRTYDDCFESGDGDEVVVLIMQTHAVDAELRTSFDSGYARDRVDAAGWKRRLTEWEARQSMPLRLD